MPNAGDTLDRPIRPTSLSRCLFRRWHGLVSSLPLCVISSIVVLSGPALQVVPLSVIIPHHVIVIPHLNWPLPLACFPTRLWACILSTNIIHSNSLFDRCIYRDFADTLTHTTSLLSACSRDIFPPAFPFFGWCCYCHCLCVIRCAIIFGRIPFSICLRFDLPQFASVVLLVFVS
jgi:hypothetical protein